MPTTLRYGNGENCELELANGTRVGPSSSDVIDGNDLSDAVRSALADPLDFPPLSSCTVPGDRVVVAVEQGVPLLPKVIAGISSALEDAGVEPDNALFVFQSDPTREGEQLEQWAASCGVNAAVHSPDDQENCSLVSVTQAGEPLRMNRSIGEADVVLPVGLAGAEDQPTAVSKYAGLYPEFADGETIARFHQQLGRSSAASAKKCQQEVDEAGWLLGVNLSLRVVPGPAGSVAAVMAGEPHSVTKAAQERYRDVWSQPITANAQLAVATLTGPAEEQSWESIRKALLVAESVLRPGGVIAICSELAELPGPAVRTLAGSRDYDQLQRSLARVKAPDSQIALQLCRALERGGVYFCSQLSPEMVEDLGITPIQSSTELKRLTESFDNVVVLEDAHRLICTGGE